MTTQDDVLAAARARGAALARGDESALSSLLHASFLWTSHRGEMLTRESYLRSNIGGTNIWYGQQLDEVTVVVANDDVAVLRCVVVDDVDTGTGRRTARMAMTQTWVRSAAGWVCLAGHAGPRIDPVPPSA